MNDIKQQLIAKPVIRIENPGLSSRYALMETLCNPPGIYPEWVYKEKFNAKLGSGFRYFLLKIEHLVEIIFAIDYLIRCGLNKDVLASFESDLTQIINKNSQLLAWIITYLHHYMIYHLPSKDLLADQANISYAEMHDIEALESILLDGLPDHLTLINFYPGRLHLMALICHFKEMRCILLQLMELLITAEVRKE